MVGLSSISAIELAVIALVIGWFSSKLLNADELNVVGNLVVAIGSIMLTIAAQEQFLKSQEQNTDKTIEALQNEVKKLTQTVNALKDAAK